MFLNFTGGYGSCKISKLLCFSSKKLAATCRKVGYLAAEEGVELHDILNTDMISDMKAQIYRSSLM
jgi:hypothetical protein